MFDINIMKDDMKLCGNLFQYSLFKPLILTLKIMTRIYNI